MNHAKFRPWITEVEFFELCKQSTIALQRIKPCPLRKEPKSSDLHFQICEGIKSRKLMGGLRLACMRGVTHPGGSKPAFTVLRSSVLLNGLRSLTLEARQRKKKPMNAARVVTTAVGCTNRRSVPLSDWHASSTIDARST